MGSYGVDVGETLRRLKKMNKRRHMPSDGRGIYLGDGINESVRAGDLIAIIEMYQTEHRLNAAETE